MWPPLRQVWGKLDAPLVYKHMSKTGGTYLREVLQEVFGDDVLLLSDFAPTWDFLPRNLSARTPFLLGSVREPCDYYVSLWTYSRRFELLDGTFDGPRCCSEPGPCAGILFSGL